MSGQTPLHKFSSAFTNGFPMFPDGEYGIKTEDERLASEGGGSVKWFGEVLEDKEERGVDRVSRSSGWTNQITIG